MLTQQLSQQHKVCTKSSQTKPKHGDGKRIQIPSLAEELWANDSYWEGESVFLKDVVPGRSAALQGKAMHPRVYGQHKLDLMVFSFLKEETMLSG